MLSSSCARTSEIKITGGSVTLRISRVSTGKSVAWMIFTCRNRKPRITSPMMGADWLRMICMGCSPSVEQEQQRCD